jgi:DNA (cytosine-5)-methyltransferase 1
MGTHEGAATLGPRPGLSLGPAVVMRELSLFTGAGGGLYGSILLGWTTVCAVEVDPYRRKVLEQRQRDGVFGEFPIYEDVRRFDGREWRGRVDVVTAGVPCQPHSVASRGRERPDKLWPEVVRILRQVEPRAVFIENVPGVRRALPLWISDLRGLGYTVARPLALGASQLGAPHLRNRIWLLAYADREFLRLQSGRSSGSDGTQAPEPSDLTWWSREPAVSRVAHGVAARKHRLAALGDGQVPLVAATAWRLLTSTSNGGQHHA